MGSPEDQMKSLKYVNDLGNAIVVNELLAYAFQEIHRSNAGNIVNVITAFYRPQEIIEAKETLWNLYEDLLTSPRPRGKNPADTNGVNKIAQDIISKGVSCIVDHFKDNPDHMVKFVAANLARIPRFTAEETNLASMVARLSDLELRIGAAEKKSTADAERIQRLENKAGNPLPVPARSFSGVLTNTGPAQSSKQSSQLAAQSPQDNAPLANALVSEVNKFLSKHDNNSPSPARSETWQKQRVERKRLAKIVSKGDVVVGRKTNGKLACGSSFKDIFIFHVDDTYTEDHITKTLEDAKIKVRRIKRVSHELALNKSFKVTVKEDDLPTALNPELWDSGIKCRRWLTDKELREAAAEENKDDEETSEEDES